MAKAHIPYNDCKIKKQRFGNTTKDLLQNITDSQFTEQWFVIKDLVNLTSL